MAVFEGLVKSLITNDLFNSLKKQSQEWQKRATVNAKNAFFLNPFPKDPVDTGKTQKSTDTRAFITQSVFAIRFFTPIDDGYEIFPFLGLSTSKKYGVRNWLEEGAKATAKEIFK